MVTSDNTASDNLRLYFQPGQRGKIDCVRINKANTFDHESTKFRMVYMLVRQGRRVIVEGELKNGQRPDICILDLPRPRVIEIIASETEEHAVKKNERYMGLPICIVKTPQHKNKR